MGRQVSVKFVYSIVVGGSVLFPKLYPPHARSSQRMLTINEEYSVTFGFWYTNVVLFIITLPKVLNYSE